MRKVQSLNRNWRFHLGDEAGADYMGHDDRAWPEVTLPHDWSVAYPFDKRNASGTGYLPGGTAWYRKHFVLPDDVAGKRVRVCFGGVYKHARVWVNSNYLGQRAYGYASFGYDVSAFVRPGENVISVRVEHEEVADSRWFTGSGIYRDVTLEISDPRGFLPQGIFVTTETVNAEGTAVLRVRYETAGAEHATFALTDGQGNLAATAVCQGKVGETELTVPSARLWSPECPYLYTLKAQANQGETILDEEEISVGIRTLRFDANHGFFLNGVSMKMRGVCMHHDAGALGAAVPKSVWRRRLEKFKAMGCNALRTAHNPPDTHLLDLCDEMGFLVMDEAFDEWEGAKNKWWQGHNVYPPKRYGYAEDFPQWHRIDLEDMIRRDRNHPCVVIWSIGNEIDYPNDPYVTPFFQEVLGNNDANKPAAERQYDPRKPDAGRLTVIAKELTEIVHELDTSRPVTSALSFPELSNRTGFADVLDVVGYNYKEVFYAEDHAKYPGRVIYGSENGKNPEAWYAVRDNDYICAQFLWTGVDFLGECRGWPVRISQAGLLDLAGYEKPQYAQRKAMWTQEPYVRIAVGAADANYPDDEAFCWQGEPGETRTVSCYTNAAQVELFLNGQSLGTKKLTPMDGCRATWKVPYAPGELRAVVPGSEDCLYSTGGGTVLALHPDRTQLTADGASVVQVEVCLLDGQGHLAAAYDTEISYQITGDAEILGIENGAPDDLTPYASRRRATKGGRAIVYLRAGIRPDEIILHACTKNGIKAQCALRQE